jgi:DNA-directed RNA polymerase subunit K/omega
MDRVLDSYDSKFRFVLLASRRAEQILRGAQPKLDMINVKPCRIGMEELRHNLIEWDYGPAPAPEATEVDESDVVENASVTE